MRPQPRASLRGVIGARATAVVAGFALLVSAVVVPLPAAAAPAPTNSFPTLPPGAALPSGQECADRVVRSSWEPRPENAVANQTRGRAGVAINGADDAGNARLAGRIDGNFTGTTDEIIQWGSCKWGFDTETVRAVAVKESWWQQSTIGDAGQSFGLLQVKRTVHTGTYPLAEQSTAFNVDYALAWRRACYEGYFEHWVPSSARGDEQGCIGLWFSGSWKSGGAQEYAQDVMRIRAAREWAGWTDQGTGEPAPQPQPQPQQPQQPQPQQPQPQPQQPNPAPGPSPAPEQPAPSQPAPEQPTAPSRPQRPGRPGQGTQPAPGQPAPQPQPPAGDQPSAPGPGSDAHCTLDGVTGRTLCNGFRDYWNRFGGLAVFGHPLTGEFVDEASGRVTQIFERARFEWHPGSWAERFDVQLGRLGSEVTAGRASEGPFERTGSAPGCSYFEATGHNLCNGFRDYWNQFGGLAIYGMPISEEFREVNPDTGETYTVQYFERQRVEWHPGVWPARFDTLLGRLGAQLLG